MRVTGEPCLEAETVELSKGGAVILKGGGHDRETAWKEDGPGLN